MNEIVAVIYYAIVEQDSIISSKFDESSVYFAFSNLMVELADGFLLRKGVEPADTQTSGVETPEISLDYFATRIKQYEDALRIVEPLAAASIETN